MLMLFHNMTSCSMDFKWTNEFFFFLLYFHIWYDIKNNKERMNEKYWINLRLPCDSWNIIFWKFVWKTMIRFVSCVLMSKESRTFLSSKYSISLKLSATADVRSSFILIDIIWWSIYIQCVEFKTRSNYLSISLNYKIFDMLL